MSKVVGGNTENVFGLERTIKRTSKGAEVTIEIDHKAVSKAVFTGERAFVLARKYFDMIGLLYD